eukprot:Stramenopile-MAST_4_protein_6639
MCDIPENVETDLTLAAVAVGGAMVVAEKAGSTKAHKMKAKLEKKQDEWARFKKKYPTFFGVGPPPCSVAGGEVGLRKIGTN